MNFQFKPVGVVHSCFKQHFGIPRQPGLVNAARGWIEFYPPYDREEAFAGIESFSHLWVIFLFHKSVGNRQGFVVRPPRSTGQRNLGIYATRSPNRPNQLGQSVVELVEVENLKGKIRLHVKGMDMIDGTPVLDIKPYLPYADCLPEAHGGFAHSAPDKAIGVKFSPEVQLQIAELGARYPDLQQLVQEVLQYDPRPRYYRGEGQKSEFSLPLYDLQVYWCMEDEATAVVVDIQQGGG